LEMNTLIKKIDVKGKNKRMFIFLFERPNNDHFIVMGSKTLIDFKTRQILTTENVYSVETFVVLKDVMSILLENSEVKNKILLRELANVGKFKGKTDLI
jgi:hypothetical protein